MGENKLGLNASFDIQSGFLLVSANPNLGDEISGKKGHERGDMYIRPHKIVSKAGTESSGWYYPREGDRVIAFNYTIFKAPANWLDVDPPGPVKSWSTDGRRMLWKEFFESLWQHSVERALVTNPCYLELERGISGWLGTTWEAYGLSLSWHCQDPHLREQFYVEMMKDNALLSGFGLCIDNRDWSITYVEPGTVADRLGIVLGSTVVKMNGAPVAKRTIPSFLREMEGASELSLAILRNSQGKVTGYNIVMKVADILPGKELVADKLDRSIAGSLPFNALRAVSMNDPRDAKEVPYEESSLSVDVETGPGEGAEPAKDSVQVDAREETCTDALRPAANLNSTCRVKDEIVKLDSQPTPVPAEGPPAKENAGETEAGKAARWTVYTPPAGVSTDRLWQDSPNDQQRQEEPVVTMTKESSNENGLSATSHEKMDMMVAAVDNIVSLVKSSVVPEVAAARGDQAGRKNPPRGNAGKKKSSEKQSESWPNALDAQPAQSRAATADSKMNGAKGKSKNGTKVVPRAVPIECELSEKAGGQEVASARMRVKREPPARREGSSSDRLSSPKVDRGMREMISPPPDLSVRAELVNVGDQDGTLSSDNSDTVDPSSVRLEARDLQDLYSTAMEAFSLQKKLLQALKDGAMEDSCEQQQQQQQQQQPSTADSAATSGHEKLRKEDLEKLLKDLTQQLLNGSSMIRAQLLRAKSVQQELESLRTVVASAPPAGAGALAVTQGQRDSECGPEDGAEGEEVPEVSSDREVLVESSELESCGREGGGEVAGDGSGRNAELLEWYRKISEVTLNARDELEGRSCAQSLTLSSPPAPVDDDGGAGGSGEEAANISSSSLLVLLNALRSLPPPDWLKRSSSRTERSSRKSKGWEGDSAKSKGWEGDEEAEDEARKRQLKDARSSRRDHPEQELQRISEHVGTFVLSAQQLMDSLDSCLLACDSAFRSRSASSSASPSLHMLESTAAGDENKCRRLEEELLEQVRRNELLQQMSDRTIAECRLQVQYSKEAEGQLVHDLESSRLELHIMSEELEAVRASESEHKEQAERLRRRVKMLEDEKKELEQAMEKERQRSSRRDASPAQPDSPDLPRGKSPVGMASGFSSIAQEGEQVAKRSGAGRGGKLGGVGDQRMVGGEELMKLLEKAWEEGKEAAERRMEFEKKELQEQWQKVKDIKLKEKQSKTMLKAITQRKVW
ncbi:hypothetical protein GUITHDRAFT_116897 [Guillardia theta CCMP2712]|uniref:PDZ domain-containing protein n=4 Tax=Guillardia theta TaxID=55529 RepID=L1IM59_GUITC|nr:hypothetical protein GUITHDRAFT_116897 [Guillardia theta CCMP2712]EKX36875.1 hypothetical protein GUITHDRAFT_116897 [Guillardia theta CCMP2712]|eukprot:XP_005823855.1 hypothetical protein GUITHDRAFT_116897 [Guillardia theta CCMP2712]